MILINFGEAISDKRRITIVNGLYRPPNGLLEPSETFLSNTFFQMKASIKAFSYYWRL